MIQIPQIRFLHRLVILFLVILFYPIAAQADIKIITWDENITLNKTGKEAEVKIQGKVFGLEKNYHHNSYYFSFSPTQKITITKVIVGNEIANYSFKNNQITIDFPEKKKNGDRLSIYFSYKETYNKIHEFLREETIYVPEFAKGAQARIYISFPWDFESATLNRNVVKVGNGYRYSGVVPEGGVREKIKLTLSKNSWDVVMHDSVVSTSAIGDAEVLIPKYFKDSGQRMGRDTTISTPRENGKSASGNKDIYIYKGLSKNTIDIVTKARIYTGRHNRMRMDRNPDDYLEIDPYQTALLTPILEKIKRDPALRGYPLYAKIGRYVHDFITYDIGYVGKLLSVEQIINGKTGVCIEYAQLFNSLARLAGIPSLVAYGAANGEYDKFEGHAWNLIYDRQKWVYVDPTWNLMSGIVSSSHIYFHDESAKSIEIKYYKRDGEVKVKKDFKVVRFE